MFTLLSLDCFSNCCGSFCFLEPTTIKALNMRWVDQPSVVLSLNGKGETERAPLWGSDSQSRFRLRGVLTGERKSTFSYSMRYPSIWKNFIVVPQLHGWLLFGWGLVQPQRACNSSTYQLSQAEGTQGDANAEVFLKLESNYIAYRETCAVVRQFIEGSVGSWAQATAANRESHQFSDVVLAPNPFFGRHFLQGRMRENFRMIESVSQSGAIIPGNMVRSASLAA